MPAAGLDRLETERLILRRSVPADAEVFRVLWSERDPRVPAHRRIDAEGRPTVQDVADRIRTDDGEGPLRLLTVEHLGGEVIGYCGLVPHGHGSADEPELAYELLRSAHGHGYATEAASAVVGWAIEAGYRRLWAGVWDWNTASCRVLDKLGFTVTDRVTATSAHGVSLLTVLELPTARDRP